MEQHARRKFWILAGRPLQRVPLPALPPLFHILKLQNRITCQRIQGECFLLFRGRLLVGTFVALSFNLFTMLSIRNKPFAYVSEGMSLF